MNLIIALCAAVGLLLHSGALSGQNRGLGMFCYYTNLSNLVVGVYCLLAAFLPALRHEILWFSMAMGIFLTFLIYHFVLLPGWRKKDPDCWKPIDNLLVHYITPLLTVANWLVFAPKGSLNGLTCLWWLVLPVAYLVFAMLRAQLGNIPGEDKRYPYFFMNPDRIGWKKTVRNLLLITAACVVLTELVALLIMLVR